MTSTQPSKWGYVLTASIALVVSGAVALAYAGGIADEYHVDDVPVALWLLLGVGLIGLLTSLPIFLAKRQNRQQ